MELIGRANLRTVGLFQKRATSQAPFLHQRYPASTVLRACPPPHTAEPAPHGVLVESHDLSSLGFPVFRRFSLPCMPTPLPRRNRWMLSLSRPTSTAFPVNQEGQLPRFPFRGLLGVHSRFGLPVGSITQGDLYAEYFNEFVASFVALVASGRATDWPGGIRTHWRSPTFTAY